jgi:LmbE family N-acetylglucosaminyl deacetylase
MRALELRGVRRVVALGAHPDDIEIGAGGLLLALEAANPGLQVHYVLFTGTPDRHAEARAAAISFLPTAELAFSLHSLPDGRLPAHWQQAKEIVESVAGVADLVLTPCHADAHQDHRTVAELAPTAFRDALILQYELPKWDGDLGRPNLYVPIDARRKVELLNACFPSQKENDWWDDEVFLGLARLRGMECRSQYAEAFYSHKAVLSVETAG